MAIEKQIWLNMIKEGAIPNTSFLSTGVNMDEFVEFNTLNLAEAGVDPIVFIDKTDDVGVVSREDIAIAIPLHTFDTENTLVKNIEEKESSYPKMESVVRSHRNAMLKKIAAFAAHGWTPNQNSDFTPVLIATGGVNNAGYRRLTFEDVLTFEAKYRAQDAEMGNLVMVLNSQHLADLMAEDMKLYKEILVAKKLFSFDLFDFSQTPIFNGTTGVKKAMGAAVAATDAISSFGFDKTEVMHASGDMDMFLTEKDPKRRGDIVGFQKRFTAQSIRNKGIGAIYSPKV